MDIVLCGGGGVSAIGDGFIGKVFVTNDTGDLDGVIENCDAIDIFGIDFGGGGGYAIGGIGCGTSDDEGTGGSLSFGDLGRLYAGGGGVTARLDTLDVGDGRDSSKSNSASN